MEDLTNVRKGGACFDICWSPPGKSTDECNMDHGDGDGNNECNERQKQDLRDAPQQNVNRSVQVDLHAMQQQELLDFGSVVASDGCSYEGILELYNSKAETAIVSLDRFSTKHGFSIQSDSGEEEPNTTSWQIEGESSAKVLVMWRPTKAGGVRQMVNFSFLNEQKRRVRVAAFLCGVATAPPKAKPKKYKSRKAVKQQAMKRVMIDKTNIENCSARENVIPTKRSSTSTRNIINKNNIKIQNPSSPMTKPRMAKTSNDNNDISNHLRPQKAIPTFQEPTTSSSPSSTSRYSKTSKTTNAPPRQLVTGQRKPMKPRAGPPRTLKLRSQQDLEKNKEESKMKATRKELKMRRVLFDERWMEKQEKGFAAWLNFVLHPNAETSEDADLDPNKALAILARKQKEASIQRLCYTVFHSSEMENVAFQVDREIANGGIAIRKDKDLYKDLGLRKLVLDLLLRYNGPWLRLGLETVLGMQIPGNTRAIKKMVTTYFLGDPELDETYRDTKKGLFDENPEYKNELRRRTLRRFLLLVVFLDRAKAASVIEHPNCLFCVDSPIKSSADMIIAFAKEFLSGEGNVLKHLHHSCDYVVHHKQTVLDEFNFEIANLAVDLRDGVRLTRAVELLTGNRDRTLSQLLRVPAVSRLQKLHNAGVALKELQGHGIELGATGVTQRNHNGGKATNDVISNKDLVDGHRRKTLALLWKMIAKWKLSLMLPASTVKDEIARVSALHGQTAAKIVANSKLQQKQQEQQKHQHDLQRSEPAQADVNTKEITTLLLEWCQVVCAHHGMRISNMTTSMASGRALCLLIHHYHPKLLERQSINSTVVDVLIQQGGEDTDLDWAPFEVSKMSRPAFRKALLNEQANFSLVNECAGALGSVPVLLPGFDSENVPEEKMMQLFLTYLCSRLLASRDEIVAATKIQRAWLQKRRHERFKEIGAIAEGSILRIQKNFRKYRARKQFAVLRSAVKIQAFIRGLRSRMQFAKTRKAVITMQACHRARVTSDIYLLCRHMIITVQSVVRRRLAKKMVENLVKAGKAIVCLQSFFRKCLSRKPLQLRVDAVHTIHSFIQTAQCRANFLEMRSSSVKIQSFVRGSVLVRPNYLYVVENAIQIQCFTRLILAKRERSLRTNAATTIQTAIRCYNGFQNFLLTKEAAVIVQSALRCHSGQIRYRNTRESILKIQSALRMYVVKRDFKLVSSVIVKLQAFARCSLAQSRFQIQKSAAVKIQALIRQDLVRVNYEYVRLQIVRIQALGRGRIALLHYNKNRDMIVQIQANARRRAARTQFVSKKNAAIRFQALCRKRKAEKVFSAQVWATLKVQSVVRMWRARVTTQHCLDTTTKIQALVRRFSSRKRFLALVTSTVKIQALVRQHNQTQRYRGQQLASLKLQSVARMYLVTKLQNQEKSSAIAIQKSTRAFLERTRYLEDRRKVILLQNWCRMRCAVKLTQGMLASLVRVQSFVRTCQQRACYLESLRAVTKIESFARMAIQSYRFKICLDQATKIQAFGRRIIARGRFVSDRASIICIQSLMRRKLALIQWERVKKSVISLQALVRSRQAFAHFDQVVKSTIRIQSTMRTYRAKKRSHLKLGACKKMQSFGRMVLAKMHLKLLVASLIKIQSFARKISANQEARGRTISVLKIQSFARQCLARARFTSNCKKVVTIQSFVRTHLCKRKRHQDLQKVRKIQALWRCYQDRCEFIETSKMIVRIQAFRRMCSERHQYQRMLVSISCIQSTARRFLARKSFLRIKDAVIAVQSLVRKRCAQRSYDAKVFAIVKLQGVSRGFAARRNLQTKTLAAMRLESFSRMVLERTKFKYTKRQSIVLQSFVRKLVVRSEYQCCLVAIRRLQSVARMRLAQNVAESRSKSVLTVQQFGRVVVANLRMKRAKAGAIFLQKLVRGWLVRRKVLSWDSHATRIQSAFRGFRVKLDYQWCRHDVIIVQSVVRCHQDRVQYIAYSSAAVEVQRFARKYCMKALVQRRSIVKLQALVRGAQTRQRRSKAVKAAEERLTAVSETVTEQMTLGSRTRSALEWLLRSKDLAHILQACITLQLCTAASRECCESFLETDASDVLLALIRSCNRSEPHVRVLQVALTVLVQVGTHDRTTSFTRVFAAEQESAASLVDLLQIFRDKKQIFAPSLKLLEFYCSRKERAYHNIVRDHDLFKRLCSIEQVLKRKVEISKQSRRPVKPVLSKAQKEMSERHQHHRLSVLLKKLSTLKKK